MGENPKKYSEAMDFEPEEGLGALLDRCGHYFAHRIGGSRRGRDNVIALLSQRPGISQKELAQVMGVRPASVSELVTKLERKGLVQREKDEKDHRSMRLTLTEAGRQYQSQSETNQTAAFQALSPEERETLERLLRKLLADWHRRYPGEHGGHMRRNHRHREENNQMEDEHGF